MKVLSDLQESAGSVHCMLIFQLMKNNDIAVLKII